MQAFHLQQTSFQYLLPSESIPVADTSWLLRKVKPPELLRFFAGVTSCKIRQHMSVMEAYLDGRVYIAILHTCGYWPMDLQAICASQSRSRMNEATMLCHNTCLTCRQLAVYSSLSGLPCAIFKLYKAKTSSPLASDVGVLNATIRSGDLQTELCSDRQHT